jgi:IclR family pca regulon transcriptional regulator
VSGRGTGPDFVEALARGLDVLTCFDAGRRVMTLTEVAEAANLARPTARRLLLTLQEIGYVRSEANGFALTPKVVELGMAYVSSLGLWEIARPHMTSTRASPRR